jgi:hypothetical protein
LHGYCGDFHAWEAGLYKTPRSSHYFLPGTGGPLTQFSRSVGQDERTSSTRIIPMSLEDARKWAEQNLETSEVEAGIADAIEDA